MSLKALIFDLDGTILDTEILWQKAAAEILIRRGITPSKEFLQSVLGATVEQSCTMSKKNYNLPDPIESLTEEMSDLFLDLYKEKPNFITGFNEFFKKVIKSGISVAIATNTSQEILNQTRTIPSLQALFGNHIYTPEDVFNNGKPLPDLYLYAAKQLNIPPAECLVIEDSKTGITAAKAAGMKCIRISTDSSKEKLAGEDGVVSHYAEIPLEKLINDEYFFEN